MSDPERSASLPQGAVDVRERGGGYLQQLARDHVRADEELSTRGHVRGRTPKLE